jgi:N6-adenosine-specific RNA methylase IME4
VVDDGLIAVSLASKIAELPKAEQRKIAKRAKDGEKPSALMREHNRNAREAKMATIKKGNKALSVDQKYSVILADPPWLYNEGTTTPDRRIDNHYPMMPLDEICALPVRKLAAKHAVLFLWITSPLLLEAAPAILKAWGKWDYKSQWVWHKTGKLKKNGDIGGYRGTGHWAIIEHELVLICTRGEPPTPDYSARFPSVFTGPVGKHSEQPVEVQRRIECMYPKAAKIELFCREPRKGWAAWGNQAD